jgi:crotonobetainyl-CoA:carnitine CoA-transferase CaiB-like acyl-CoA transferase
VTHVLAGPFAAYQLAVLGADVIKVEHPDDPDQSRSSGTDKALNRIGMGTGFLTQASNKRSIALDLKKEADREVLKKLVATADVFVENYRPGAFEALGLGYDVLSAINPRLIYASFSAFGQHGPRGPQTAYDHVIQATSGIMAMTGTKDTHPVKFGAPVIDYATGMTGAFALSAALFQRERTGRGQRIDMAMLDVAMILMSSHLTGYLRNGVHPKPHGNRHPHATNGADCGRCSAAPTWSSAPTTSATPTTSTRSRCSRRSCSPAPPTSGRNSCRRGTCRRRACARWARRSPIRSLRAGR